jgi:hypothetical protein
MSNSKFVKGIKEAFVLFEGDPPVSVSVHSMRTVIERRKLKTDRNGNVRITREMIAEAKTLDLAKGEPALTEEDMGEAVAALMGKPGTGYEKVEIEDLERDFGSSEKPKEH